jgi:hypothetical protein
MTPVDGYYLNRVIHASLDNTRGVLATFGHETVHALRELGMFSDKEWDILTRKAKSEWIKKYRTEERYGHLSEEEQIEEAIADAFGDWMGGKYKPTGVIQGLLNRMKLFLESMGSTLRGQGFDSTDKVFQRALKGELKGAREERPSDGAKFAQRKPEHTHVVVDPRNNNKVMGYYKGLSNALRGRDRLDNAYGAYRYRVEKIKPEDAKYALPIMYSHLEDKIQSAPKDFDNRTGKDWAGWLKNNGIKQEEMFWSGINNYLELNESNQVTRAGLLDFVQKTSPQLGEVVKGGRPVGASAGMTREQIIAGLQSVFARYDQDIKNLEREKQNATSYSEIKNIDQQISNLRDEAFRIAEETYPLPRKKKTRCFSRQTSKAKKLFARQKELFGINSSFPKARITQKFFSPFRSKKAKNLFITSVTGLNQTLFCTYA